MLNEALGRANGNAIASAIAAILLGALVLAEPVITGISIFYLLGGLLVFVGIVKIVFSFMSPVGAAQSIAGGVLLFIFGLLCLLKPDTVSSVLTVLVGIYVVADGAIALSDGVFCVKSKIPGGASVIIFALTLMICGFYVMFAPFSFIMQIAGIALIADGIFNIILVATISKRIRKVKSELVFSDES